MRLRLLATALGLALVPSVLAGSPVHGQSGDQAIVAKVGSVSITVADVEARLRTVPDFQLATFGKTPSEIRRAFVEQVMVKEVLLGAASRARKVSDSSEVQRQIKSALRMARLSALRKDVADAGIDRAEVLRYYEANKDKFESPERILVWRILANTEEEAGRILAEAKKTGTPERWNELAREHSTDKATAMRGGNLGFLSPDGSSQHQGVKVDPAVVKAAAEVKDGELFSKPIPEGSGYAVIWRRGSMPAVQRSLDNEADSIAQVLWRQKLEEARKEIVSKLRTEKLRDKNPQLVEMLDVDHQAAMGLQKRPGVVERPSPAKPAPSGAPGRLR